MGKITNDLKDIAKGICLIVMVISSALLVGILLFGGDNSTSNNVGNPLATTTHVSPTPTHTTLETTSDEDSRFMQICNEKNISLTTPTDTLEPVESPIKDFINVHKSSQDITVECKHLSVSGNNNAIQIDNIDVEKITILGSGNSVGYSCDASPKIVDHGDYNDVWQRWLS